MEETSNAMEDFPAREANSMMEESQMEEDTRQSKDESSKLELRNYQKIIVDEAVKKNTLVVLATGSGKTLIATHVMAERILKQRQQGTKKIIAFLAPTKILVGQQQKYISTHLKQLCGDVNVVSYTGETSSIDGKSLTYWNEHGWANAFLTNDVLVMTPQICKQMLQRKFFHIQEFDCIIIDECHHATGEHPLVYICEVAKACSASPLMFCMTASPITSRKGAIRDDLEKLAKTLGCNLFCNEEVLDQYQTQIHSAKLHVYRCSGMYDRFVDGFIAGETRLSKTLPPSLEMPNDVSSLLGYAYLRAKHSASLSNIYMFLFNMRAEPTEFPCLRNDFPALEIYRNYKRTCQIDGFLRENLEVPGNHLFKFTSGITFGGVNQIQIVQTFGQILKIVEENGTLSGLYAFLVSLGNSRRMIAATSNKFTQASLNNNLSGFRQASQDKKRKRHLAFELPSTAGIVDHDALQNMANEIISSPFKLQDLLHDEYMYCVTLFDFFYGLVASLGSVICKYALKKFIELQQRPQESPYVFRVLVAKQYSTDGCDFVILSVTNIIIYCLFLSIINGENIENYGTEGVLDIIRRYWQLYVNYDDSFSFNEFQLREKDCYKSMQCAGWCVISNITAEDLSIWCNLDDPDLSTFIEPLISDLSVEKEKVTVESDKELFPRFHPISSKVQGLCKVWTLLHVPNAKEDRLESKSEMETDIAHIIFCKMRLQAAALHFVLSIVVENLHPELIKDYDKDSIIQSEVRGVLNDILDFVCDERKHRVNFVCAERDGIRLSKFRPVHMTGSMMQKNQLELLRMFKSGYYNVVFATDVMEEGLDVRACKFVINFDTPATLKSFVQRKGRCRAKDSQFITLIPAGIEGDKIIIDLLHLQAQEKVIEDCTSSNYVPISFDIFEQSTVFVDGVKSSAVDAQKTETDFLDDFMVTSSKTLDQQKIDEFTSYKVSITRAEADGKTSTQLLHRYCQQLPHDNFYNPKPIFWITRLPIAKEIRYSCSILLPPHVEPKLRFVSGPPAKSKSLAKGLAAMECIKLLHQAGELNDFLMIIGSKSAAKTNNNPVAVNEAQRKKRKLITKISTSVDLTDKVAEDITEHKIEADQDFELNAENKDLLKISSKFVPDCLLPEQKNTKNSYFLYIFQATYSDSKSQEITSNCPSCVNYFQGLNSFGLVLLAPLSHDVLEDSIRGYIRESEGVDISISFLAEKSLSELELTHMQRFHKGVVCWEPDNKELFTPDCRMNWLQNSKTDLLFDCAIKYPVPQDEWALSSNGAWYIIFPLPEMSELSCCCSNLSEHSVNKAEICARMLKESDIFNTQSAWIGFLQKAADEAQTLAHNLAVQEYVNTFSNQGFILPFNHLRKAEELQDMLITRGYGGIFVICAADQRDRKKLMDVAKLQSKLLYDFEVKETVKNTLLAGVVDIEKASTDPTHCLYSSLQVYSVEEQSTNRLEGSNALSNYFAQSTMDLTQISAINGSQKKAGNSLTETVSVSFYQIQLKKYPMYRKQIDNCAKNAEHYLLRAVSMIPKLTLHCLLTKTANRYVKPQRHSMNLLVGNQACFETAVKEKRRKYHTHAVPVHLMPELCQPLGRCKWYAVGLLVPSVVWRVEALLLATEAKTTLLKSIVKFDKNILKTSEVSTNHRDDFTFNKICHTNSLNHSKNQDMLLFDVPKASLMLEAISPRLVGEMIDSERLELLGDSLLKLVTTVEVFRIFPTKHEGFLSFERTKVISNLFLFERACKLGLHHYVRAVPLSSGKQKLLIHPAGLSFEAILNRSSVWNHNMMPPPNKICGGGKRIEEEVEQNDQDDSSSDIDPNLFHDAKSYFSAVYPLKQHQYAEVRPKVLADAVEAIIGAFYMSGGLAAGIAFIKAIGAWPKIEHNNSIRKEIMESKDETPGTQNDKVQTENSFSEYQLHLQFLQTITESSYVFPEGYPEPLRRIALGLKDNLADLQQINDLSSDSIEEQDLIDEERNLENDLSNLPPRLDGFGFCNLNRFKIIDEIAGLFNYRFQNWRILEEALTHCSCQKNFSNQRFEFLGDAVLDFAVVTLLYSQQPWATPGDLAKQKSDLTCNRHLGYVGMKMRIFKYLCFYSPQLHDEFTSLDEFLDALELQKQSSQVTGAQKTIETIINGETTIESAADVVAPQFSLARNYVMNRQDKMEVDMTEEDLNIRDLMSSCISEMITHIEESTSIDLPSLRDEGKIEVMETDNCDDDIDANTLFPEEDVSISNIQKMKKNTLKVSYSTSKAVADLFEALIGAIFLDAQCTFETVVDVVKFIKLVPAYTFEKDESPSDELADLKDILQVDDGNLGDAAEEKAEELNTDDRLIGRKRSSTGNLKPSAASSQPSGLSGESSLLVPTNSPPDIPPLSTRNLGSPVSINVPLSPSSVQKSLLGKRKADQV